MRGILTRKAYTSQKRRIIPACAGKWYLILVSFLIIAYFPQKTREILRQDSTLLSNNISLIFPHTYSLIIPIAVFCIFNPFVFPTSNPLKPDAFTFSKNIFSSGCSGRPIKNTALPAFVTLSTFLNVIFRITAVPSFFGSQAVSSYCS